MNKPDWKQLTKHRTLGLVTMGLGVGVLFAPMVIGSWVIALLGIVFFFAGLIQFVFALTSDDRFASIIPYFAGTVCVLIGCLLFLSPRMAVISVLFILFFTFVIDGGFRIYSSFKLYGADRWWTIANGLFTIGLAIVVAFLVSSELSIAAIGIVLGLWLTFEGWTMLFMPERNIAADHVTPDLSEHPDYRLGLEPNAIIRRVQEPILQHREVETNHNILYSLTFVGLFFAIHVLRTDADWSILGFISPFAAVIGDIILALILGTVLLLPMRLLWRKLTRPIERSAWRRFRQLNDTGQESTLLERGLEYWLSLRLRFALELQDMHLH